MHLSHFGTPVIEILLFLAFVTHGEDRYLRKYGTFVMSLDATRNSSLSIIRFMSTFHVPSVYAPTCPLGVLIDDRWKDKQKEHIICGLQSMN